MTSIHHAPRLISTIRSTPRVVDFIMGLREAIQGWRKRKDVRANLHGLSDRELIDMGIARGEIDYVAAHPFIDPRGVRSPGARST